MSFTQKRPKELPQYQPQPNSVGTTPLQPKMPHLQRGLGARSHGHFSLPLSNSLICSSVQYQLILGPQMYSWKSHKGHPSCMKTGYATQRYSVKYQVMLNQFKTIAKKSYMSGQPATEEWSEFFRELKVGMLQLGRMSTVAKGRVLHADARCRLLFFIGHWRRIRWRRHPPLELIEWLCLILIIWEKPDPRVKLVRSINPLKEHTRFFVQ